MLHDPMFQFLKHCILLNKRFRKLIKKNSTSCVNVFPKFMFVLSFAKFPSELNPLSTPVVLLYCQSLLASSSSISASAPNNQNLVQRLLPFVACGSTEDSVADPIQVACLATTELRSHSDRDDETSVFNIGSCD